MALCMQSRSVAGVGARTSRPQPFRGARMVVRASPAVGEIVEKLKTLSLLEASELVSEIEKTFGVDASAAAPVAFMGAVGGAPGAAAAPVVEEKTTFDVVLEDIPADKKASAAGLVAPRSLPQLSHRPMRGAWAGQRC
jgi:large subunit ribosomal protein L7/L12